MVPVLFAYGGWQTQISSRGSEGAREKPARGLLLGVLGVVVLYIGELGVLRSLGRRRWLQPPPRHRRMRWHWAAGAMFIAAAIAISTWAF